MNGYDFTASIVQSIASLAWPAAMVWIVYLFREKLREILPLLRLKHNDTEVSFQLKEAADLAEALPAPPAGAPPEEDVRPTERSVHLAEMSPRAAIIDAYAAVESEITKMANERGMKINHLPAHRIMTALSAANAVDSVSFRLFLDLHQVRNRAIHEQGSYEISLDDALKFQDLAARLVKSLQARPAGRGPKAQPP